MNCPICKIKMKLKLDIEINEKYYDCSKCGHNVLQSIARMKRSKETDRIIKYSYKEAKRC
jgi:Zn ribbon nucleic-acid-binding protein